MWALLTVGNSAAAVAEGVVSTAVAVSYSESVADKDCGNINKKEVIPPFPLPSYFAIQTHFPALPSSPAIQSCFPIICAFHSCHPAFVFDPCHSALQSSLCNPVARSSLATQPCLSENSAGVYKICMCVSKMCFSKTIFIEKWPTMGLPFPCWGETNTATFLIVENIVTVIVW